MLKPIKRAVHFDFHTMPGIDNIAENFDAARLARQMKDAHVEYINFFGRCNIGFSYYPTKVGVTYPGLDRNLLGEVVTECHKLGIGVSGYLNVGVNHEAVIRHPEWAKVNMNGQVCDLSPDLVCRANYFRLPCTNTGYGDYLLEEIQEILDQGVDGIFCDCMILRPCLCSKCKKEMMQRGIDVSDVAAVRAFADEKLVDIVHRIRRVVPQDKYLFLNGVPYHYAKGVDSHIEIECLPAVSGYDKFIPYSAMSRPICDNVVYMNGRFQIEWADFGGYKGKASIENDFYDALMNGATTSLGDHLHPVGIANERIYRELGEIYARLEQYEEWTDGARYVSEIAVLSNVRKLGATHYGVGRILAELKYSFDILTPEDDFSAYPLLILPDDVAVEGAFREKLADYINNGGKVLSTGTSAMTEDLQGFVLPQWSFTAQGKDPIEVAYYRTTFSDKTLDGLEWECYEPGILMKGEQGASVLAEHITTYFKREYDGEHFYLYAPPKQATGYAVALMNPEQSVCHVSFPLFRAYMKTFTKAHRALVGHVLRILLPQKQIEADSLPATSRLSLTRGADYTLLHVKVTYPENCDKLGIIEEHAVLGAGKTVRVKGAFQTASLLPDKTPLSCAVEDGYTRVTLPEIEGYAMILLQ